MEFHGSIVLYLIADMEDGETRDNPYPGIKRITRTSATDADVTLTRQIVLIDVERPEEPAS